MKNKIMILHFQKVEMLILAVGMLILSQVYEGYETYYTIISSITVLFYLICQYLIWKAK